MSVRILIGDCREKLRELRDASVNCCVTSPPYFGLRDYGTASWKGGAPGCEHKPRANKRVTRAASGLQGGMATVDAGNVQRDCHCGARRIDRQMGLEPTPDEFVAGMVEVFREVRRVLRDDGTLWLNIGDSYATDPKGPNGAETSNLAGGGDYQAANCRAAKWDYRQLGYKRKDLIGVPWMLAFALRADGWFLRSDMIWAKPNGMPESVQDRPTRSHEMIFLLSKSPRYFYNNEALRTPAAPSSETRLAQNVEAQAGSDRANGGEKTNGPMKAVRRSDKQRGHTRRHDGFNDRWDAMERAEQVADGSNLRSVWWLAPAQFRDGHFATMPPSLAEICVLGGCPRGGTVLDPFGGAGTTGLVADRLQRDAILIELNPEYAEIARNRIASEAGMFGEVLAA